MKIRMTLKNYRGFSDEHPATIEFGSGITALIGANNSGKSSLKLVLFELRGLFDALARHFNTSPNLPSMANGTEFNIVGYPQTHDQFEIFNNSNDRDLVIEIEVIGLTPSAEIHHTMNRAILTCSRQHPVIWSLTAHSIESPHQPVRSESGFKQISAFTLASPDELIRYDFNHLVNAFRILRDARYYGAFRNALNQGSGQHYDFQIGTAFIDVWSNWKTSGNKAQSRAIGKITEEIRRLFEFDQLEINASPGLKTLLVTINGHQYRLEELGSGISQFIMALGNAATSSPTLILIDEPETNLHPALQIDFLLSLAQFSSVGCLFSTHSVGLARSVAEHIFAVQRSAAGHIVRRFESVPNYVEFLGELSFSTFKEVGCDRILLVEGVSDVKVAQQLLRMFGKEHTTVILPLGGNQLVTGGREAELYELKRLSSNVSCLVDSERQSASGLPDERRVKFAEVCEKLDFRVLLTERRATENYFSDRAVKAALGSAFQALGPYELLKDLSNGWRKSENWRIAHQMTKEELLDTDVGQFLERV